MSYTQASLAAFLKNYYTDSEIQQLAFAKSPFLADIGKEADCSGLQYIQPLITDTPQGMSAALATAQTNVQAGSLAAFTVPWRSFYGVQRIDGITLEATRNDRGAFAKAATFAADQLWMSLGEELSAQLYRDGTGALGTVSAYDAGTRTITLATPGDIVNFHVGMTIRDYATEAKVGVVATITDRVLGTFTLAAGAGAWAGADVIIRQGTKDLLIQGVAAYVPSGTGTATLNGVDRSVDWERRGGIRYNAAGAPDFEQGIIDAAYVLATAGGSPDRLYMNPMNFGTLVKVIGTSRQITQPVQKIDKAEGGFGFSGLRLFLPTGVVEGYPDPYCPRGVCYLTKKSTWKMLSMGGAPRWMNHVGSQSFLLQAADAIEMRGGWYANIVNVAPGATARVALV